MAQCYTLKLVCGDDYVDLNDLIHVALVPGSLDLLVPEIQTEDVFYPYEVPVEDIRAVYKDYREITMTLELTGAPNDIQRFKQRIDSFLTRAKMYQFGPGSKVELWLRADRVAAEPTFGRGSVKFEVVGGTFNLATSLLASDWASGVIEGTLKLKCRPLGYTKPIPVGYLVEHAATGSSGEVAIVSTCAELWYNSSRVFTNPSTFTVSFWVKPYDASTSPVWTSTSDTLYFFDWRSFSTSAAFFRVFKNADNKLHARYGSEETTVSGEYISACTDCSNFSNSVYTNITTVYSNGSLWLYTNGALSASTSVTSPQGNLLNISPSALPMKMVIGTFVYNPLYVKTYPCRSWISDLRIWEGSALSASDVLQNFTDGRGWTELPYLYARTRTRHYGYLTNVFRIYNSGCVDVVTDHASTISNWATLCNVPGNAPAGIRVIATNNNSVYIKRFWMYGLPVPETTASKSLLIMLHRKAVGNGQSASPYDVWGGSNSYYVAGSLLSTTSSTLVTDELSLIGPDSEGPWFRGPFTVLARVRNESPATCNLYIRLSSAWGDTSQDYIGAKNAWQLVPTTTCVWYAINLGTFTVPRSIMEGDFIPEKVIRNIEYKVDSPCNNSVVGLDGIVYVPEQIVMDYMVADGTSGLGLDQGVYLDTIQEPPVARRYVKTSVSSGYLGDYLTPCAVHWPYAIPHYNTHFIFGWSGSRGDSATSAGNWVHNVNNDSACYSAFELAMWVRPSYFDVR